MLSKNSAIEIVSTVGTKKVIIIRTRFDEQLSQSGAMARDDGRRKTFYKALITGHV